jgi:[protein-PII] uridylyltransferase
MPQAAFSALIAAQLISAGDDLGKLKELLASITIHLSERFDADEDVSLLVHARADLIDQVLRHLWQLQFADTTAAALVAVGGYGRGELHPYSDIDLLFLVAEEQPRELEQQIAATVSLLWDIGLHIGQTVRTARLCAEVAAADITIATALMESRLLAGNAALFTAMQELTAADKIWPADAFFQAKLAEQGKRHAKYDETAHNLEPNIKETPGGLRDLQTIEWVAKRHYQIQHLNELVDYGFLTEREFRQLDSCKKYLWRIRFALHMNSGRAEDRLLFDLQQKLAAQFEHIDNEANLAVEQLMQRYYRTITRLQRLSEMLLQYFEESILQQSAPRQSLDINRRFRIVNGYIEASDQQLFSHRPLAILELFLLMAQHPEIRGMRASTIRLIHEHLGVIDRRFRQQRKAKQLFLTILRQPQGVYRVLRSMNRYGVLAAYIPAFANIVGRMQFDLFHVYTVDTHTLFLLRNLRRLTVPEYIDEFPFCSELMLGLEHQEVLMIAALFHDIAKGRGGDHSELGAIDAHEFCREHDLPEAQCNLISWLVQNHLVMSMTAQRKDIEDPDVIREFAEHVQDAEHLQHLYLLTVCDMRATNPQRWNNWKDTLLRQLYDSTLAWLQSSSAQQDPIDEIQHKQNTARLGLKQFSAEDINTLWMQLTTDYFQHHSSDEIIWHSALILGTAADNLPQVQIRTSPGHGASEILAIAPNRDNLWSVLAWLLDQCALNIVKARLEVSDQNLAINSFSVLEEDGSPIHGPRREDEICQRLLNGIHQLSEPPPYSRRVPRQLQHFSQPTSIEFFQDSANHRTLLRLSTSDRPGLLSLVGIAFYQAQVRLLNAIIATIGERAEDTFFLVDVHNQPITASADLARIEALLLQQLEGQSTENEHASKSATLGI